MNWKGMAKCYRSEIQLLRHARMVAERQESAARRRVGSVEGELARLKTELMTKSAIETLKQYNLPGQCPHCGRVIESEVRS